MKIPECIPFPLQMLPVQTDFLQFSFMFEATKKYNKINIIQYNFPDEIMQSCLEK